MFSYYYFFSGSILLDIAQIRSEMTSFEYMYDQFPLQFEGKTKTKVFSHEDMSIRAKTWESPKFAGIWIDFADQPLAPNACLPTKRREKLRREN